VVSSVRRVGGAGFTFEFGMKRLFLLFVFAYAGFVDEFGHF
jgi:hypothetical protein